MTQPDIGYLHLVRTNRTFRQLWLADVVSLFGDWFNTIALYDLIQRITPSPFALGLVVALKMAALALCSPIAGVIADRYDRRRLMIGADLLRALVVMGFLFISTRDHLPALYALITLQVALGAVFDPARSASLPNICQPHELTTANALLAATWSTLLALGAALGGFATAALGTDAVFAIDAASYLLSAAFLARAVIPSPAQRPGDRETLARSAHLKLLEGLRYLRQHPHVARIALAKAAWATGGAAFVYILAILGAQLTAIPEAIGVGLLLTARGLGSGIGPVLGRALLRNPRAWPAAMGVTMILGGLAYATLTLDPHSLLITIPIVLAHALAGINWVFSSVLLQRRVDDAFAGRVFATEWLLVTLSAVIATLVAGALLEYNILTPSGVLIAFAIVNALAGLIWLLTVVPAESRHTSPPPP